MKILHIFKREPSKTELEIVNFHSKANKVNLIKLYEDSINYDNLVKEVFEHDKVFCW
ncbi:MAG: hypothetical protein ACYCT7_02330 [bacterium]